MSKRRKSSGASRKRDRQQAKFYKWTWQWMDWNVKQMGFAECKKLILKVCAAWQVPPPRVFKADPKLHASYYDDTEHCIGLIPTHHNMAICLHEAAHAVVFHYFPEAEDHGPTFVGVFIELMCQAGVAPKAALTASASAAGLRWRSMWPKKKAR